LKEDLYAHEIAINAIQNSSVTMFGAPTADFSMGGFKLIDVADPLLDTDVATRGYVESRIASIQAGGGGNAGDLPVREAIGWPYTDESSISTRLDGNAADITSLKATVGTPYTNANSVSTRLTTAEGVNATQTGQITNLNLAVGMPYTGATNLTDRMGVVEPKVASLE
jgi:hypothetical protein